MDSLNIEIINSNTYKFIICKKIYDKLAVLNTVYKYSKNAYFKIDSIDEEKVAIYVKFIEKNLNVNIENFVEEFNRELIDQQIRLDLEARTGYIKNLIYEKAFAAVR